ncbi:MAG: RNA 2',3'-cyclic phosphodiesterase [Elusimicrobia bacterium]|nr:RNA 2',3'-cyclic phosphodiesterase [Elusimicrobiota bacterium]
MRLFVALPFPDEVRNEMKRVARAGEQDRSIRWLPSDGFHITLKFLGETETERLPALNHALREAAAAARRLNLQISGAGVFPDDRHPKIFWAGLSGDTAELKRLAADLEARTAAIGFPTEERAFTPHATLARCHRHGHCGPKSAETFRAAFSKAAPPPFEATEMHLMRSHLGPNGADYELLEAFPFPK